MLARPVPPLENDADRLVPSHLYVFRKPAEGEDRKDFKYSVKWR